MNPSFFRSRFCVSSLLWRAGTIQELARGMMRLGLEQIELAARPLAPEHYQPGGDNSRLFNLLAEAGVRVAALRLTGLTYEEKIRALDDAGARGIPIVLDRVERLNFPDLIDRLRQYNLCAMRAGAQLVLENVYYTSCDTAASMRYVHKVLRQPTLGFGFAPLHAVACGLDPIEEVTVLGESLQLVYLWDVSPNLRIDHFLAHLDPGPPEEQLPGNPMGRLDWDGYFKSLAQSHFKGVFNFNCAGTDSWGQARIEGAIANALEFGQVIAERTGLGAH
jgi:sugar phosphate isomerase/epimerase